jgi:Glycosyl hydrolases family 18
MSRSRLLRAISRVSTVTSSAALLSLAAAGGAATAAHAAPVHVAAHATSPGRSGTPAGWRGGGVLPAHVFSPYFEAYTTDNPAVLSSESGAKYLVMAFIQAPSPGSCQVDWNGDPATPVALSEYGSDIAAIRAAGGDIVPSFGGYTADTDGTEIADSCTSVPAIAAAYEKVITTYGVTRLDMDVESNSLTNTAGIDRRNKAIAMVENWARRTGRTVQFVYTLPTFVTGLSATGLQVLQNAVTNHARIDIVNILTFDYYDGKQHEMGNDTITAADNLYDTLHQLYPDKSPRRLWSMVGVTDMPGIDDYGPLETFTTADATTVENWAAATGIGELSFWALQRDNGGCPGTKGADSCSGIVQTTWQFSHAFEPFTRR